MAGITPAKNGRKKSGKKTNNFGEFTKTPNPLAPVMKKNTSSKQFNIFLSNINTKLIYFATKRVIRRSNSWTALENRIFQRYILGMRFVVQGKQT